MKEAPRVVFDCNILLQALAFPSGPAGTCVQFSFDGIVQLFISPVVIAELLDVTTRPKVIRKLRLTSERVNAFVEAIHFAAVVLTHFPEPFTYNRDPDDAHYVNLALAANAKIIVSRDDDLLDLMDSSRVEGVDFQSRFPSLRIVTPVQFIRDLAESPS